MIPGNLREHQKLELVELTQELQIMLHHARDQEWAQKEGSVGTI